MVESEMVVDVDSTGRSCRMFVKFDGDGRGVEDAKVQE